MPKGQHAIRFVAQKTGLSSHVIRVWERRYGAVAPQRSGTNRRLYSDVDLNRLILLAQASRCGHNIGTIARLPEERLRVLAADCLQTRQCTGIAPDGFVTTALDAVKALDSAGLEAVLTRAAVAIGNQGVLCRVIAPLVCALGTGWKAGDITAAQEHFATTSRGVFSVNEWGRIWDKKLRMIAVAKCSCAAVMSPAFQPVPSAQTSGAI
ncbi:MAG: MerR family transcriptional regulator, partial [Verrucomicrobia bacterium]|nr:MerR family transcriptional regulator [Verrucomicrobiota bacterium]